MSVNPNKTVVSPKEKILTDYHLAVQSREISLLGRKEVFMGKAKFGIFGDGKEVAQIVFSKMFKRRLAIGLLSRSNLNDGVGPIDT